MTGGRPAATQQASRLSAIVAVALMIAGCGDASRRDAAILPDCVDAGPDIERPTAFPKTFPLPEGTVLDEQRRQAGRFTVVEGYVPGELEKNQEFFLAELPKAGFELGEGDAEEHEAETDFSGPGLQGHLKIHDIPGCTGALTLQVVVARG